MHVRKGPCRAGHAPALLPIPSSPHQGESGGTPALTVGEKEADTYRTPASAAWGRQVDDGARRFRVGDPVDVIPTFAGRVWHQISTLAVNVNVVRGSPQERGRARPVGRLPAPESSHQVDIVALPGQTVSMGRFPRHRLPARPNARDNGVSHAPGLPPAAGSRSDFRCSSL